MARFNTHPNESGLELLFYFYWHIQLLIDDNANTASRCKNMWTVAQVSQRAELIVESVHDDQLARG